MKNLLIYLNPSKNFNDEYKRYAEIQIENSLNYWDSNDIILATNFPYIYKGIRSIVVPDNLYCDWDARTSKVSVIIYLLENKMLKDFTWFHDFDCFQNNPFKISIESELGLTDYGWKNKFNTGSFFFKPKAIDIFKTLWEISSLKKANEEPMLWDMYKLNSNNIQNRSQRLNITYNLGKRYTEITLPIAKKPIKIVHFHPYWRPDRLERFKNSFLSKNLTKILDEKNPRKR